MGAPAAAKHLGVNLRTLYAIIDSGELPAGSHWPPTPTNGWRCSRGGTRRASRRSPASGASFHLRRPAHRQPQNRGTAGVGHRPRGQAGPRDRRGDRTAPEGGLQGSLRRQADPPIPSRGREATAPRGVAAGAFIGSEVRALADTAPPQLRAAVVLAACTGLRQGELFGLTAGRVVLLRRELRVNQQMVTPNRGEPALGPCKTARSVRTVPVVDHALSVLSQHVERYGPGEHELIFHREGRPWARMRAADAFSRLAARAGVEASGWHALRHHAASVLIAQGLNVTAVAAVLGHSPAECLKSYAGWWPNEDEQIRAAVARAWAVTDAQAKQA